MNREHDPLKLQLEKFVFDVPEATFTFAQRLGRENGWTSEYTARVIGEYRRFLYLAVRAGHPVTPSDSVDEAWHLHLVYTESYWHDLCRDTLRCPLHHGPTRGGAAETAKFHDWYGKTLESYRRHFGAEPPSDIWPSPDERFGTAGVYQRVNLRGNWVIPKPALLQRGRGTNSNRVVADSLSRRRVPWTAVGVTGILAAFAGCSGSGPDSWNVFDWFGPPFLGFYAVLSAVLILAAIWARRRLVNSTVLPENEGLSDPYQVAMVAGGRFNAVRSAVITLCERGLLQLNEDRVPKIIPTGAPVTEKLPAFEEAILNQVRSGEPLSLRQLVRRLELELDQSEHELMQEGLLVADDRRKATRWLGATLIGVAILVGVVKVGIGLDRDRPVGYLVTMILVLSACLALLTLQLPRLTQRGLAALADLQAKYRRYSFESLRKLRGGSATPSASLGAAAMLIPLAVGLYGGSVLENDPVTLEYRRLLPPGTGSGNASGSGCSGSGCGSSDGGGGGGGCGGGGCGGCGGGGGD